MAKTKAKAEPALVLTGFVHHKWAIPLRMMHPIEEYIDRGRPVGDFLREVISNDLRGTVGHGDDENVANLPAFVVYFHNHAPAECHGSPGAYKAWVAKHSLAATSSTEEPGQ